MGCLRVAGLRQPVVAPVASGRALVRAVREELDPLIARHRRSLSRLRRTGGGHARGRSRTPSHPLALLRGGGRGGPLPRVAGHRGLHRPVLTRRPIRGWGGRVAGLPSSLHGLWRSLVSASVWGTEGRRFKSSQPDSEKPLLSGGFLPFSGALQRHHLPKLPANSPREGHSDLPSGADRKRTGRRSAVLLSNPNLSHDSVIACPRAGVADRPRSRLVRSSRSATSPSTRIAGGLDPNPTTCCSRSPRSSERCMTHLSRVRRWPRSSSTSGCSFRWSLAAGSPSIGHVGSRSFGQ